MIDESTQGLQSHTHWTEVLRKPTSDSAEFEQRFFEEKKPESGHYRRANNIQHYFFWLVPICSRKGATRGRKRKPPLVLLIGSCHVKPRHKSQSSRRLVNLRKGRANVCRTNQHRSKKAIAIIEVNNNPLLSKMSGIDPPQLGLDRMVKSNGMAVYWKRLAASVSRQPLFYFERSLSEKGINTAREWSVVVKTSLQGNQREIRRAVYRTS